MVHEIRHTKLNGGHFDSAVFRDEQNGLLRVFLLLQNFSRIPYRCKLIRAGGSSKQQTDKNSQPQHSKQQQQRAKTETLSHGLWRRNTEKQKSNQARGKRGTSKKAHNSYGSQEVERPGLPGSPGSWRVSCRGGRFFFF